MRRPWQGKCRSLGVSGFRRRSLVRPCSNSKAVGDAYGAVPHNGNRRAVETGPSSGTEEGRPSPSEEAYRLLGRAGVT